MLEQLVIPSCEFKLAKYLTSDILPQFLWLRRILLYNGCSTKILVQIACVNQQGLGRKTNKSLLLELLQVAHTQVRGA